LVPFPFSDDHGNDIRDLALAWETLEEEGVKGAETNAEHYLALAAKADPNDTAVLSEFGTLSKRAAMSNKPAHSMRGHWVSIQTWWMLQQTWA
jgi:hypothetical protein